MARLDGKSAGDADVWRVLDIILSYSVITGVRLSLVRILHAIIPCDAAHMHPRPHTHVRMHEKLEGSVASLSRTRHMLS